MARRGFLDYVLGGAVGGLEGLAQKRVAEEEKKRMEEAATRQRMLDTVSLLNAGYDPEGFSMDAPGATPRPVFDTQMVGTRKFTRSMSPGQTKHMEEVQKERAENRSKRLDASLLVPKVPTPRSLRYTEGENGISVYNPDTGTSTFQPYPKGYTPKKASAGDGSDKVTRAGIDKAIAGAGKIVTASLNQEKMAETQLAALDRIRPDPNRFQGTNEQLVAAEAAWQKRVDAAQRRLEAAQAKTSRLSPTYEGSLVSRDTTGYGEAFGPPAAPAAPARQPTYNTKEATLSAGAQRKINEIQSSDLTPEEKQEKVQQVNAILSREIMKARGQG